jgi:phage baseplate assembly protein gpV
MMNAMQNQMRLQAQRALENQAKIRIGIIDGYDPSHYSVKVRIQPENILTGWLPLTSPWVGNGWGMYAPPSLGDIVDVHFQQNDPNAAFVVQKFFSNTVQPLAVPSGEFWLVHASGSSLKMTNDGNITISAANKLILHGANEATFDAGGTGFKYQPSLISTFTDGVSSTHSGPQPPEIPT